ncbi:hypothetical protein RG963_08050 [Methanosarcina sp. Z-7115]|uniref:Uncharacterized protein n=1 Tax=Methanosarcina baikalica TaxID=3073890 RepID=A0ABU2D189_9EURY|nr:hypothetical protein [Methanosarcina sp. Z-7115]MDR7665723.1 hypothetical protein [Methanosarcina sp. Z-7115]
MNEYISLIKSGQNESAIEKALDFYYSIEEIQTSWGISFSPKIENSIKISSSSISYNRYSIPIFGINGTNVWQKTEKLLNTMNAPRELYNVIKKRHNENGLIIAGLNLDMNTKRIYFRERDKGYGYEFDSNGNWDLKVYPDVPSADYTHVIEDLKLITSEQIFYEIKNIVPLDNLNLVTARSTPKLVLGYHIYTSPKQLKLLENYIFALVSNLNNNPTEFYIWFEKNKNMYLHWLGIGYTEKAGLEITLYIRSNDENWNIYYPPLDFFTFLKWKVFNIDLPNTK